VGKFFFENKAQAGSVFKLLIGAVVGIAIVGIIYSIIVVMGNQKTYLSEEVFSNKITMAMKNPIGTEYFINDFTFQKNRVLTKKALSEQTGLAESCISLFIHEAIQNNSVADVGEANINIISFKNVLVTRVGVKCNVSQDPCPIECSLTVYNRGYKPQ